MKSLVTYFSASGVTKQLAIRLARVSNSDLVEIIPSEAYSKDDLNWTNQKSRSTIEMRDKSSRPSIKNHIDNINEYDIIFIGFPIWWYREPSIIDTFIESYDLSKKKILLFATSGGSSIEGAIQNTRLLKNNPNIIDGKRFKSSVDDETLLSWMKKYY